MGNAAENCQVGHLARNCDEKHVTENLPVRASGGEVNLYAFKSRILKTRLLRTLLNGGPVA